MNFQWTVEHPHKVKKNSYEHLNLLFILMMYSVMNSWQKHHKINISLKYCLHQLHSGLAHSQALNSSSFIMYERINSLFVLWDAMVNTGVSFLTQPHFGYKNGAQLRRHSQSYPNELLAGEPCFAYPERKHWQIIGQFHSCNVFSGLGFCELTSWPSQYHGLVPMKKKERLMMLHKANDVCH